MNVTEHAAQCVGHAAREVVSLVRAVRAAEAELNVETFREAAGCILRAQQSKNLLAVSQAARRGAVDVKLSS